MHASEIVSVCRFTTAPKSQVTARPRSESESMKRRRRPHLRESRKSTNDEMMKHVPRMDRMDDSCRPAQVEAKIEGVAEA